MRSLAPTRAAHSVSVSGDAGLGDQRLTQGVQAAVLRHRQAQRQGRRAADFGQQQRSQLLAAQRRVGAVWLGVAQRLEQRAH